MTDIQGDKYFQWRLLATHFFPLIRLISLKVVTELFNILLVKGNGVKDF